METLTTPALEAHVTTTREHRLKAMPWYQASAAPERSLLPVATIQAEWDNTLARLRELGELVEQNALVHPLQFAYVSVRHHEGLDLDAIDRILFDNLLPAVWSRTHTQKGTLHYGGEWLWNWRRAVPFTAEKVGHINRLVPWQPQYQWTYRFNLIEAEL